MYENMGLKIMAGVLSALIVGVISWGISVNARLAVAGTRVESRGRLLHNNDAALGHRQAIQS